MKNRLLPVLVLTVLISTFSIYSACVARGGGGGFGGHSGFGGSAVHSTSGFSGGGRTSGFSSPSTGGTGGWGAGSSRVSNSRSAGVSSADRALYDKAKMRGTVYKSRDEAVTAFKAQHQNEYPSTFASQPAARPDYIPQSTTVNGSPVPVIYNPQYGGYGYYNSGRWQMYSVFLDAAMLATLMHHNNYYYGPPPAYGGNPEYGYHQNHFSWFWLIVAIVVVWLIIQHFKRRAAMTNPYSGSMGSQIGTGGGWNDGGTSPTSAGTGQLSSAAPAPFGSHPFAAQATAAPRITDVDDPGFWRQLSAASVITLKDKQAIEDSMRRGKGPNPIDYIVERVRTIVENDGLATWMMYKLQDPEQELWFMAKIVDSSVDLRTYYVPDEFHHGNRRDILDRGDLWLFQQPSDVNNYAPSDLEFTTEISYNGEVSGQQMEIEYSEKGQGALYGEMTTKPAQSGFEHGIFAAIVEYQAEQSCDNPELLLLELGGENDQSGGLITLMLGSPISQSDVTVIAK